MVGKRRSDSTIYPTSYYELSAEHTDPARIQRERDKARKFKKTQSWQIAVNRGLCHYCEKKFPPGDLTLDHVVPLARGGKSVAGNMVPACRECNRSKKLDTPVEQLFKRLDDEKKRNEGE